MAAIIGGFAAGAIILVESLLTDIADEDFVRNHEDREGIYFGFWRMGQKVARSITLGLTGLMLGLIGYEESLVQQRVSRPIDAGAAGLAFRPGSRQPLCPGQPGLCSRSH